MWEFLLLLTPPSKKIKYFNRLNLITLVLTRYVCRNHRHCTCCSWSSFIVGWTIELVEVSRIRSLIHNLFLYIVFVRHEYTPADIRGHSLLRRVLLCGSDSFDTCASYTAYSCGQHGPVTAWFCSARPGNVITVPKTSYFLGVGLYGISQWNCFC